MSIIDKIVKKFNSEDVIKFSDKDGFRDMKSWCSTGSATLDYNLRTFGFPTGIIEIAGKSRSGKTTIGLMAMKDFMDKNPDDGIAVILSSENRDNKDYALQLGMDVKNIIIIKIKYVEAQRLLRLFTSHLIGSTVYSSVLLWLLRPQQLLQVL